VDDVNPQVVRNLLNVVDNQTKPANSNRKIGRDIFLTKIQEKQIPPIFCFEITANNDPANFFA
jgi:hypothetical protein